MNRQTFFVLAGMLLLCTPVRTAGAGYSTDVEQVVITSVTCRRGAGPDPADRTIEVTFAYRSPEGSIAWSDGDVQCDCDFLLNGLEVTGTRAMLGSSRDAVVIYVHPWTVNVISGWDGKIRCRLQMGGRGIDAEKEFKFK